MGRQQQTRIAHLLKQRRRDLGFSLQDVQTRAAQLGVRLPASTLMEIERGDLNPNARRWIALLHIYNLELLADSMELGGLAGVRRPTGTLEELSARGTEAWKSGNVGSALAHALAIREHPGDDPRSRTLKQGALICFATYARNLGKYRLARQIVEELLVQPLPQPALTDTLVLAASIWVGLGCPEAALAMVERAAKRRDPADPLRMAYVEHQWAKVLLRSGEPHEAERHLDRAIALYREVGERYNELRALDLRTQVLEALGRGDEALACVREIMERARRLEYGCILAAALLDLGRLFLVRGRTEEAVEVLRQSLACADVLQNRRVQVYAHTRLWKAYLALGEPQAAAMALRQAAAFVEGADEASPELEEVRRAVVRGRRPAGPARRRPPLARNPASESVN